ncbi:hypothetical protein ACHAWF_018309 [Thalassiosira exigua]
MSSGAAAQDDGTAAAASAASASPSASKIITLPSGASYAAFLEPLTPNERALLDTYERIRHYEKEAARLKAEEAKRRLDEADERYRAKVRERERAEGRGSDDEAGDGDEGAKAKDGKRRADADDEHRDDDDDGSEGEDEEAAARRRKRDREISQLRKDVSKKNKKKAEKEAAREEREAMRRELMGDAGEGGNGKKRPLGDGEHDEEDDYDEEDDDRLGSAAMAGPSIKKKRRADAGNPWDEKKPEPSLIANLDGGATPVHDFSKKLGMGKASLDGSVLFPDDNHRPWVPPDAPADFLDGCLELELADFDAAPGSGGNNTLAIKFHAPQESKRFSINIAQRNNDNYNDILFHFNPRHFKGQLVINDRKETIWGNDISVPLSTLPLMSGVHSCTLVLQINDKGFDIFVEGQHCARLEHRTVLPKGKGSLSLQFPSSDAYSNPKNWTVYHVWWGSKPSMATADLSGVAGANIYSAVHPRKLFVSGLPKLRSEPEVDLRRAELERAFRKYGGPSGAVLVSVQTNSTFAFVEVASEQQADLALLEMGRRYRLNRARRTKHEALMEERAAKEAAEKGIVKESVDWD